MYYSEKNLVVDDLLYLVNSNGKMTSPKKYQRIIVSCSLENWQKNSWIV